MNTKIFIEKSKLIHGDKYDYSKTNYISPKEKVCIICPKHGEFWQKPYNHLNGQGCSKCRYEMLSNKYKKTTEKFIEEAKQVHGNKYDYSKVDYNLCQDKVTIICPIHGEFKQRPLSHIQGQGCPKCSGNYKLSLKNFIEEAKQIHGNKYDYSKVDYINAHEKVCIICPKHGEFWQTASKHLNGRGCPQCGGSNRLTNKDFIEKSKLIHGDRYDYSNIKYINSNTKIRILCPKHGEFEQLPHDHLQGKGCPKCACVESKAESEIYEYVCSLIGKENVISRDRTVLDGKELDIYVPSLGVGIEYNGLRWHSDEFNKDKNYHLNKLKECNNKGIKLIQIFEDEWIERHDIVLKKIKHILGFNNGNKIYGRKCIIKEADKHEAYDFLEKNHIQGFVESSVAFGAYYNDALVAVMTFTEESKGNWNLTRFATDNDLRCIGVAGKLFSAFLTAYNPSYVKSFADRRWTLSQEHNLYVELGFKLGEVLRPDYRYVNGQKRDHKFGYRKDKLHKKYGVPLKWTEKEMTEHLGFYRIYDCGLLRYEWNKK